MALEVQGLSGAGHGERAAERLRQRDGCRDRGRKTRAGTVALVGRGAPLDEAGENVPASMGSMKEHRGQIHSSNPIERRDREIERRTEVAGHGGCRARLAPPEAATPGSGPRAA